MEAKDVILAMKTSQDGWHSECVMTDRMKVLAEAVRELAWAVRFGWHKDEDEVIQRWADIYMVAEAIVKETPDGSDT